MQFHKGAGHRSFYFVRHYLQLMIVSTTTYDWIVYDMTWQETVYRVTVPQLKAVVAMLLTPPESRTGGEAVEEEDASSSGPDMLRSYNLAKHSPRV